MTRRPLPLAAAVATLTTALVVVPALSTTANASPTHGDQRVCAAPSKVGVAACHAHVRTVVGSDGKVRPDATTTYSSGFSPAQLQKAYSVTGLTSSSLVAVVDAYASPNAVADLAAYRTRFGLGTASFTQVSQTGGSITTVPTDVGWGQEEMLDLDMVSAMCPTCPILYVGGNSASFADLGAAVNRAVTMGAKVVSNSYGAAEFSGETTYASSYNHPGVAITVSSGDSGYGVQVPAAYNTVTAVGGTALTLNADSSRKTETVWSGAGSGCSAYITKPSWQHDASCTRRTVADVAAVADPATGVAIYDSFGSTGGANWYVFGGTSVAAPIIGGIYGLSGNTAGVPTALAYSAPAGSLFDVVSGSNTRRCRFGYLCQGAVGYDGPTGMGTPNGVAAF
ncbi:MAG: S8 family serine peptidase [Actinomycetota bacterium]|nr:S8 family serine peptidase [Actinomycetota bacterium]